MHCSNCGAPLNYIEHMDYFHCEYCDSLSFPENDLNAVRITGQPTQFYCPICMIHLNEAPIVENDMLYCGKCRGILINVLSFMKVVKYLRDNTTKPPVDPPPMNPENLKRQIMCPQCNEKMDTHPYGGPGNIVIDNCPRCKVNWLDYN